MRQTTTTNADLIKNSIFSTAPAAAVAKDPLPDNSDLIELNELNAKSNGGSELTTRSLFARLDRELLDGVQLITSRVRELDPNKKKILHLHDLPGDPESFHLGDPNLRDRFSKLVFSSHWQYQQFQTMLGVPYSRQSCVIETGIDPIEMIEKPKDKIRLIYTSTPHRGLEILVPVFVELAKRYPEIHLDVFSSFGIYGWEDRDAPYQPLFDICKSHPQITYHGWQSNEVVRAAYQQAHIFAYPSIWQETSCRSLIEGMSAGCLAVHSGLAALPETAGGLTMMYDGTLTDPQEHMSVFANTLMHAIENVKTHDLSGMLGFLKCYIDNKHSWDNVIIKWNALLHSLKVDT